MRGRKKEGVGSLTFFFLGESVLFFEPQFFLGSFPVIFLLFAPLVFLLPLEVFLLLPLPVLLLTLALLGAEAGIPLLRREIGLEGLQLLLEHLNVSPGTGSRIL